MFFNHKWRRKAKILSDLLGLFPDLHFVLSFNIIWFSTIILQEPDLPRRQRPFPGCAQYAGAIFLLYYLFIYW